MTRAKASHTGAPDYEAAIRHLESPTTWCQGAKVLAALGDRRAVIPLLEAYESPVEGGKRCLLEALDALGAGQAAGGLLDGDARQRSQALRLMELFGSDAHLPLLLRALADPEAGVRRQARQALVNQEWTAAWEAAAIKALDDSDPETLAVVTEALRKRHTEAARAALAAHRRA